MAIASLIFMPRKLTSFRFSSLESEHLRAYLPREVFFCFLTLRLGIGARTCVRGVAIEWDGPFFDFGDTLSPFYVEWTLGWPRGSSDTSARAVPPGIVTPSNRFGRLTSAT